MVSNDQTKLVRINYVGKISEKIGRAFKQSGYQPALKTTTRPIQKPQRIETQKGVYQIKRSGESSPCNKEYIGYTNRTIKRRFTEHTYRIHTNPSSIVEKHLKSNLSHNITFPDSLQIISKCSNKNLGKAQEGYVIYKYIENHGADNLLNKKEDYFNSILFKNAKDVEDATTKRRTRSTQHHSRGPAKTDFLFTTVQYPQ